jgi:hygromycin-B 7''-O-kinase
MQRPVFPSREVYAPRFTDVSFWRPYVEEVLRRHALGPCEHVETGLPGTHPVFLVGGRLVVKFFADLFDGPASFATERAIYELTAAAAGLDTPRLVAGGALFDDGASWRWPYLVSTVVPGRALETVYGEVPPANLARIAAYAARQLRALHATQLGDVRLRADWEPFASWAISQRGRCADRYADMLPARLLAQLDAFLPAVEELIDRALPPRLLHCDLNADHLLVQKRPEGWEPTGIIDFGDAKVGDPLYELGALHIGMFRCDRRLLAEYVRAYAGDVAAPRQFARRATSYAMLHDFDVFASALEQRPALRDAPTLGVLAEQLYGVEGVLEGAA